MLINKSEPIDSNLINRQEVLGYIDRLLNQGTGKKKSLEFIRKYVEYMPPAGDLISRQAALDECDRQYPNLDRQDIKNVIRSVPSAIYVVPSEIEAEHESSTCKDDVRFWLSQLGAYFSIVLRNNPKDNIAAEMLTRVREIRAYMGVSKE